MVAEWREVFLEDVAAEITVGYVGPMASEYVQDGIPFLRSQNVEPLRINKNDLKFITPAFHQKIRKSRLTPGDVVIVRTGKPGACAVVPESLPEANCSDIVIVRCGPEIDNRFLAYYINTVASAHVNAHLVGAVQQHFNVGSARKMRINLPPLPEQKAIARILGTLDDKIELNRRMNATLEAMARALFQSWFVDAVPDESALPEGWELSTIGLEAKVVGGSTPSTKSPEFWDNGEFHWVTPKDFSSLQSKVLIGSSRKVTQAGLDQITSGLLPENTVLLSSRAPVGYLALTKIKTAINQGFIAMICEKRLSPEYVMLWADSIMDKIKQAASGTTFAEISKATFRPFPIIVPPAERLHQFTTIVRALYERIAANERQSVALAETRDTLLPRLLSGELQTEEVADAG